MNKDFQQLSLSSTEVNTSIVCHGTSFKSARNASVYWKQKTKFVSLETFQRTLAYEVLVNHKTGLSGPCVLLCNDNGCTLTVAMVSDGNCNYGEIPVNMIPSNGVYYIRDGPRVLWCNHNGLATLSTRDTNKMV